ncbi:TolC family protein [Brumicola pallidula]|uniref:Outer membrane efflux protein n=1 Tax=Brumicola pallidula DSM 14239 = ACAM 615 TaxID=1121922 RepID=K6ZAM1_9ALTE|nr:TolC family protein [Glaciecola pallidula]GAC27392.1 hypothetical protein GPAL_0512 [Glaciecola pallidula DSM 14239 = ACAM 615]
MKIDAIYIRKFVACCILASFYCIAHDTALAQAKLTLHDSLTAAIEKQSAGMLKQETRQDKGTASDSDSFAWLDGSPSASLAYLDSRQSLGTTESEISINLPIKSFFLKQIEKSLQSNVESLRLSAKKQYALYLSGMIRNILWEIQVEKLTVAAVTRKQAILSQLTLQYEDMAQAQAIPQYVLLIVQKEFNDHKISLMQHQQNIENLLAKYQRLTGLQVLPYDISEAVPRLEQVSMNAHPDVIALDHAFQSAEQTIRSVSKQTAPWNVQVIGRRVESREFSENQVGLGIEVPINIGKQLSALQQSEYVKINTEYQITRSKLMHQLAEAQAELDQEYDFLQQKQILLNSGTENLKALAKAMDQLREANAPNQEFYIRTLLDTVDSEYSIQLNLIHLNRHIALMRQAAGLTL